MLPAEIPRPQDQRVALYEQRFGRFDSGKNAYWSLRMERPVTLAEGARFDAEMRAGRLAPVATTTVALAPTPGPMGYWSNQMLGQANVPGRQGVVPSRTAGWSWTARPVVATGGVRVEPPPLLGPHVFTQPPLMPEIMRIDQLPETPPAGPAVAPQRPLWEALLRGAREVLAPAPTPMPRPEFARTTVDFRAAAPAPRAAGFDMKKLALPIAVLAGVFVLTRVL